MVGRLVIAKELRTSTDVGKHLALAFPQRNGCFTGELQPFFQSQLGCPSEREKICIRLVHVIVGFLACVIVSILHELKEARAQSGCCMSIHC